MVVNLVPLCEVATAHSRSLGFAPDSPGAGAAVLRGQRDVLRCGALLSGSLLGVCVALQEPGGPLVVL